MSSGNAQEIDSEATLPYNNETSSLDKHDDNNSSLLNPAKQQQRQQQHDNNNNSNISKSNNTTNDDSNKEAKDSQPQPEPVKRQDPEQIRKRQEVLKATGEVLHQRCLDKTKRLLQLRLDLEKKRPLELKPASNFQDQKLAILRAEESRLQAECDKLRASSETFPEVLPEVTKLRVRQSVQNLIRDYGVMTPRIATELEDTKKELLSEKQLLKELKEINRALQARRADVKKLRDSGVSQESSQGRQKMLETRVLVQELTRELTRFLTRHYPPIQPDDDDPATFELRHVLEDIMNLSVSQPADPYVVLVPGEYYPPHIEQLINAGIAVRHPRDSQKLRLVDFYS